MIERLLRSHKLVSDQMDLAELRVILTELQTVIEQGVSGDIVELGCYEGTTALFIQRLLAANHQKRELHVYDSFAGLPPKTGFDDSPAGTQFKAGELTASKATLVKHFRQAGLTVPIIHKGWFKDLTVAQLPKNIAFAFLDGDFYESIRDSLQLIENNMSPGSVIIIDDYNSEALPGAARAVNEWVQGKNLNIKSHASLGIVHISK